MIMQMPPTICLSIEYSCRKEQAIMMEMAIKPTLDIGGSLGMVRDD
jgi:hypothetical protein